MYAAAFDDSYIDFNMPATHEAKTSRQVDKEAILYQFCFKIIQGNKVYY